MLDLLLAVWYCGKTKSNCVSCLDLHYYFSFFFPQKAARNQWVNVAGCVYDYGGWGRVWVEGTGLSVAAQKRFFFLNWCC